MKNNRGFTLLELTSVVVLIGLIAILAAIPISNITKKSRQELYEKQKTQIVLAASNWATDNPYLLPTEPFDANDADSFVKLTIEKLLDEGYLDTDIIDARDEEKIGTCSYVMITLNTASTNNNKKR